MEQPKLLNSRTKLLVLQTKLLVLQTKLLNLQTKPLNSQKDFRIRKETFEFTNKVLDSNKT